MKRLFYKLFYIFKRRKVPKLDDKVYNLFLGIHNSKEFTIENAYKDFAHLAKKK